VTVTIVGLLVNGLFLGSLYGLIGLGLAFAFGVMRVVNVAHGEFVILAAFIGVTLVPYNPASPLLLVPVVAAIMFMVGWSLQAFLLDRVVGKDQMPALLITFGLSVALRNVFVEIWGADSKSIVVGALKFSSIEVLGIRLGELPMLTFAVAVALFVGLQILLSKTSLGRVIRATADDAETVQLFGVGPRRIYAISMGLAVSASAVAGVLFAMRSSFNPFSGVERLLIAFEVVIIGGVGSLWGALLGGFVLGVSQLVGLYFAPNSGLLYPHLVFFAILMFAPYGISGQRQ